MNRHLQTIVIAPIINVSKSYPTRLEIKYKKTKGWIVLDQIRTIDRRRIYKILDVISPKDVVKVKAIMMETYVS
jgi:mRNA interferase MazF